MKRKGLSAVQRTIRALRELGTICDVAEKWNQYGGPPNPKTGKQVGVRVDLFGFIDIVALAPGEIKAIQVCGADFAAHKRKILECENALEWLRSGGRIEIWSWRKVKVKRGGKLEIWSPKVQEIRLAHFEQESVMREQAFMEWKKCEGDPFEGY